MSVPVQEEGVPKYRITRSGNRKLANPPPSDITLDRNGNKLTDKQIKVRKRQLAVNGTNGRRTVTRGAEYFVYLRSPEWADVKRRYRLSKLPDDCFVCLSPWNWTFHFHHRTYKNLGCERLMDIVPVCPECHTKIHQNINATGINLWKATSNARRNFAKKKSPARAKHKKGK